MGVRNITKITNIPKNCFKLSFINISKKTYNKNKEVIAKPVPLDKPINTAVSYTHLTLPTSG